MKKYSLFLFLIISIVHYKIFAANFTLESPAFKLNTMIPVQYTCSGDNLSPPLSWRDVPPKTQSLALIVEDPDAASGVWTHWILFNLPPNLTNIETGDPVPSGAAIGKNSWGSLNYRGPCPPLGVHRYVFTLYALDKILALGNGSTNEIVKQAITGHVIGSSVLVGLYQKN
jgi:Raf kinase inhibitor-like YbhB/YbcL family protein